MFDKRILIINSDERIGPYIAYLDFKDMRRDAMMSSIMRSIFGAAFTLPICLYRCLFIY